MTNDLHFQFSTNEQAQLLEYINNLIGPNESNIIISSGVEFDKSVMYLANAWTRHAHSSDDERSYIHSLQNKIVITTIGALANYLTEDEWKEWTDFILIELSNLRTFNGSFLGYLWHCKMISTSLADILNVLAWYYSMYYVIGNRAYQYIRPRVIQDKASDAFILSNQLMTILQMNLLSFTRRFNLNQIHTNFVEQGFIVISKQPKNTMNNWALYYESINHQNIDSLIMHESFKVA